MKMGTLAVAALCAAASMSSAQIGDPIVASGGDVTITILESTAGFTSDLYFDGPGGPILIGSNRDVGTSVNLGSFLPGTELVFRLFVRDTETTFFSGLASRNPDDLAHARVDPFVGYSIVGFEDITGGGDLDYDDCTFRFENVVPAPGAAAMLFGGMGMALRRRRR